MVLAMRESGNTTRRMVMASSGTLTGTFTKADGLTIKQTDMGFITIKMALLMKETGLMICKMETALKHGAMVASTKVVIRQE